MKKNRCYTPKPRNIRPVRADEAFAVWGTRAPAPTEGQDPRKYQRDLAYLAVDKLPYSTDPIAADSKTTFKDLRTLPIYDLDDSTYEIFERDIYRAVPAAFARNDTTLPGEFRMIQRVDLQTGHKENLFLGRESFVRQMMRPGRYVKSCCTPVDDHGRPCPNLKLPLPR
jgi:hypothetical protein